MCWSHVLFLRHYCSCFSRIPLRYSILLLTCSKIFSRFAVIDFTVTKWSFWKISESTKAGIFKMRRQRRRRTTTIALSENAFAFRLNIQLTYLHSREHLGLSVSYFTSNDDWGLRTAFEFKNGCSKIFSRFARENCMQSSSYYVSAVWSRAKQIRSYV